MGEQTNQTTKSKQRSRQIIGISLTPETALEFKQEAELRNISLRHLFEELWDEYKATKKRT